MTLADSVSGSVLRVVPGEGRLARRADAVLFSPAEDTAALVAAFDAAPSADAAVAALQALVVEAGFDVSPFALVTWESGVHLLVFGAVEVVTSLATVPMISGAGSGTWVEHRVGGPVPDSAVQISVGGPTDADSDLRLGVTRAGGFELSLDAQSFGTAPPVPADVPVAPPSVPAETVSPAQAAGLAVPAVVMPDEADDEDEPTLQAEDVPAEPVEGAISDGRLVESQLCSAGHANRPGVRACRVCALTVGDTELSFVPQPSLGRLRLRDGSVVELDRSMVIGRKPKATEPGDITVAVAGDDVSRSHVRVIVRAWDVFISDLSSRNGTYLRVGADPSPTQLDAGVEQILEPDTTIHLGSAEVTIRFEAAR